VGSFTSRGTDNSPLRLIVFILKTHKQCRVTEIAQFSKRQSAPWFATPVSSIQPPLYPPPIVCVSTCLLWPTLTAAVVAGQPVADWTPTMITSRRVDTFLFAASVLRQTFIYICNRYKLYTPGLGIRNILYLSSGQAEATVHLSAQQFTCPKNNINELKNLLLCK